MDDNKKNLEDDLDLSAEDLDFDDLNEDDDFSEEWDDFDDSEDDTQNQGGGTSENASNARPQKKTFLQKNFNLIVIGAVIIGGGGFIFSKFGGEISSPSQPVPATEYSADASAHNQDGSSQELLAPAEIADLDLDGLPPMPVPIESTADEALTAANDGESLDLGQPEEPLTSSENDVLTPLPDLSNEDSDVLADLSLLGQPETDLKNLEVDEIATEETTLTMDAPLEETSLEDMPDIIAEPIAEDTNDINFESVEAAEYEAKLNIAAETEARMSGELSTANEEIDTLNATIQSLEKKITALETEVQSANKKAEKAQIKAAEAATPKTLEPTKKPEQKTQSIAPEESSPAPEEKTQTESPVTHSKTTEKQDSLQWVLQSAQPGQATIAPKQKGGQIGDLRRIEVGDTVDGIGKVQSIAPKNGRWVVQGTKGHISQ